MRGYATPLKRSPHEALCLTINKDSLTLETLHKDLIRAQSIQPAAALGVAQTADGPAVAVFVVAGRNHLQVTSRSQRGGSRRLRTSPRCV